MTETAIVILAAGQGTRMKSATPKVLHAIGGRPMLAHVLATSRALGASRVVVVVAPGADQIAAYAKQNGARVAVQDKQLGTGHAVLAAESELKDFSGNVLVLFADVPLIDPEILKRLLAKLDSSDLAALGFEAENPFGYGRMILEAGALKRIVEEKDAGAEEKKCTLCNAGMLAGGAKLVFSLLKKVGNDNAQGEFYLPDIVRLANESGKRVAVEKATEDEVLGVNSRAQLAQAETAFQTRMRNRAMEAGVTLLDPASTYFSADTVLEQDVIVGPNVFFGPGVTVRSRAEIRAFCHLEGAIVGSGAIIGPFARLRPGAKLADNVHVGNFVEVKNATLGEGAKANHFTYLGDASVGAATNIGAGTITCNYDGQDKHRTEIGAGVFIGSNATLVAPVVIADGAYVGAGSVITQNVEEDALALGRAPQTVKRGWAARLRAARLARKKGA